MPAIAPKPPLPKWENRRRTCLPCHLSLIKSRRAGVHSPSKQIEIWCCQGSESLGTFAFLFLMQARMTQSSSAFSRKSLAFAPCFLNCSIREKASRCQMPCQSSEYLFDFPMLAKVVQERKRQKDTHQSKNSCKTYRECAQSRHRQQGTRTATCAGMRAQPHRAMAQHQEAVMCV